MPHKKQPLLLGAHISTSGGFEKAIERGESIGCTTIQIFTKSNRQWSAKPIKPEEALAFKKAQSQSIIQVVVAHCAYLINIGASSESIKNKSLTALKDELARCESLGIPYLVLHPGSNGGMSEFDCLQEIATGLDHVLQLVPGKTMILIETMAGQGNNLCYKFEHISQIIQLSQFKSRLGVCFDTCHVFAAGYDFRTEATYAQLWEEFDRVIGLEKLKVIHLNDSKKDLGSRVDRHEHVTKGQLGSEPFRLLLNDERFFAIPKILETPKDSLSEDLMNMQTICSLLSPDTKSKLDIKVP
jgi:deoxyribonuclease-4